MNQEDIRGNPAVEFAAIRFVIEHERREGRIARDARGSGLGGAGDVESEGRVIEVKAFSGWGLRSGGLLLFTPAQLTEGKRNPNYYVYIVENVAQGDPSKFALRVLHGEHLQRVLAEAKPQRYYVPLRAADYARLIRPGDAVLQAAGLVSSEKEWLQAEVADVGLGARRRAKPILDLETGEEYRSEYQAGKALYHLVGGDIRDRHVWFKIARVFPRRFQTKSESGEWVALDDQSAPKGSTTRI